VTATDQIELETIYSHRFGDQLEYRNRVWATVCSHFWQRFVRPTDHVLDLGCGYGQFINHIRCARKWAMDLNPSARQHLDSTVIFLEQDCSIEWQMDNDSLDVVFSSNFFEHLPDKATLARTLVEARRCLREGGLLIAMGPNITYLAGRYWDFWDHTLPLSEKSLSEGLDLIGFKVEQEIARFLPYTMTRRRPVPTWMIAAYLHLPLAWRFFGRQFVVIARKPVRG
jgi:SAM-dependent methyltransferase